MKYWVYRKYWKTDWTLKIDRNKWIIWKKHEQSAYNICRQSGVKKNRDKKTGKTFSKQIETILYKSSILLLVLHVESCRRLKPFHTVADDDVTNQGLTPSLNVVLSETYFIWSACVLTRIRGVETTQNPPRCYICLIRQVWFKPGANVSAVTPCSSCVCYGQWMQRIVIKLTNYN